jgi:hypothetical protein
MEEQRKNFADRWISKAVSRKLLVWVAATVMMFMGLGVSGDQWVWISLVYIGSQAAVDIVGKMKGLT